MCMFSWWAGLCRNARGELEQSFKILYMYVDNATMYLVHKVKCLHMAQSFLPYFETTFPLILDFLHSQLM